MTKILKDNRSTTEVLSRRGCLCHNCHFSYFWLVQIFNGFICSCCFTYLRCFSCFRCFIVLSFRTLLGHFGYCCHFHFGCFLIVELLLWSSVSFLLLLVITMVIFHDSFVIWVILVSILWAIERPQNNFQHAYAVEPMILVGRAGRLLRLRNFSMNFLKTFTKNLPRPENP